MRACGRQLKSGHVELALMSALDMLRDPRWGRSEECYSEDPYLSSRMAAAAVTGQQSEGVSCVAKHFAARARPPAELSQRSENRRAGTPGDPFSRHAGLL